MNQKQLDELREYVRFRRIIGDTTILNGEVVKIADHIEALLDQIAKQQAVVEAAIEFKTATLMECQTGPYWSQMIKALENLDD